MPEGDPPELLPDSSETDIQLEDTVPFDDKSVEHAYVSVASTPLNNDIYFSSYVLVSLSVDLPAILDNSLFYPTVHHSVFMSYSHLYNTILDSGCINHLICNRRYFWTYLTTDSISIKTANCGTMVALAHRDIKFHIQVGEQFIVWTLKDCFYAPGIPVNLLSTDALQDARCGFHLPPGPIVCDTIMMLPDSVPALHGLCICALHVNYLSFLQCHFLEPSTSLVAPLAALSLPTAFLVFPNSILSPELWH